LVDPLGDVAHGGCDSSIGDHIGVVVELSLSGVGSLQADGNGLKAAGCVPEGKASVGLLGDMAAVLGRWGCLSCW
jgi:hypothetical protein